jgi:hypothetical protein
LGQHRAGGVVHAGQQVHRATVAACWAGTAQRLAVHRYRLGTPPPVLAGTVPVGQPTADGAGQGVGVQAGRRPADGGLGRDAPLAGGVVAGAQRDPDRLGRIGGPFGDRGKRAGAGQDRGGGQPQDGDQWVAAATGRRRIGDGGEIGEQVRRFGFLEGVGVAECDEGGWDRG